MDATWLTGKAIQGLLCIIKYMVTIQSYFWPPNLSYKVAELKQKKNEKKGSHEDWHECAIHPSLQVSVALLENGTCSINTATGEAADELRSVNLLEEFHQG